MAALSRRILVASSPGECRAALVADDRLEEVAIWHPDRPDGVGDGWRGRVEAVLPALGGAFVALDDESGFLPLSRSDSVVSVGDRVLVRVSRAVQGGKGPRLALDPTLTDPEPGATPKRLRTGPDPLQRFAAAHPDVPITVDHPSLRAEAPAALRPRMTVAAAAFPPTIADRIEALSGPVVALPGGLSATIHPTPALVAIDMDGGASSGERGSKQDVQFAANRAALPALLHELRLRNLSGAILLDLAGVPGRKRPALRPVIEEALARDPVGPRLLGFTALGLAEITRPRIHPPLHEILAGAPAAAAAALRALLDAPAPVSIRAGAAVVAALDAMLSARTAFAERSGHPPDYRLDPGRGSFRWSLHHG